MVANWTPNRPVRYIWPRFDTRQPDLGSGTARCRGSSPSTSGVRLGRFATTSSRGRRVPFAGVCGVPRWATHEFRVELIQSVEEIRVRSGPEGVKRTAPAKYRLRRSCAVRAIESIEMSHADGGDLKLSDARDEYSERQRRQEHPLLSTNCTECDCWLRSY
jgi:hypothetical protein